MVFSARNYVPRNGQTEKAIVMANHREEVVFAKAFLEEKLRRRVVALLESEQGRKKFLAKLSHNMRFRAEFCQHIPPDRQSVEETLQLLEARGAGQNCYVISELSSIDGKTMNLSDALTEVLGSGMGTVLSCVSGKLAYYEGEERGERFILDTGFK
jgi:hypothetical protein